MFVIDYINRKLYDRLIENFKRIIWLQTIHNILYYHLFIYINYIVLLSYSNNILILFSVLEIASLQLLYIDTCLYLILIYYLLKYTNLLKSQVWHKPNINSLYFVYLPCMYFILCFVNHTENLVLCLFLLFNLYSNIYQCFKFCFYRCCAYCLFLNYFNCKYKNCLYDLTLIIFFIIILIIIV